MRRALKIFGIVIGVIAITIVVLSILIVSRIRQEGRDDFRSEFSKIGEGYTEAIQRRHGGH